MPALAGHQSRGFYLWEDDGSGNPDFATSPPADSTPKAFGADAVITTLEGSNNAVRVFEPGNREAIEIIEQEFAGSWTVEFVLTNPWFLRAVLDNNVSSSGTDPTTHTYDGDVPYSMRIVQGTETLSSERIAKGCVCARCDFNVNVQGNIEVTLEGAYADEENVDNIQAQPGLDYRPMHFGQASLDRGGSTLSLLQDASVTIENNTDLIYELGIRTAVDYSPKQRTIDVDYTGIKEDNTELERMYGSSAAVQQKVTNTSNFQFIADNGESGSAANILRINANTGFPDSFSPQGLGDPEADLEEQMTEMAATVDAVAENGDGTAA